MQTETATAARSDNEKRKPCKWRAARLALWANLLILLAVSSAAAQPFALGKHTIGGGAGTSAAGQYSVQGTIGQPATHSVSLSGQYAVQGGFWSMAAVIQTPGAPLLSIRQVDGGYEIFWNAEASGFVLEETQSLAGSIAWQIVSQSPVQSNGQNTTALPTTAGYRFYRLRKQ